jgi:hypothetical protein
MKHEKYIQYLKDYGMSDLLESIGPVKSDYGSDLSNNKWLSNKLSIL